MKNLLLGLGMAAVLAGGAVYCFVLNPAKCSKCDGAAVVEEVKTDCGCCSNKSDSGVYDVYDLKAGFARGSEGDSKFISFDEPPLAKPKFDVEQVGGVEVLPPPREER